MWAAAVGVGGLFTVAGLPTLRYLRIFFEALRADALDGAEAIHAFEGTIRLAQFEDFVGGGRVDAWDLLKFGGCLS